MGHTVSQLVEALRYKPEGRGFDFRWCHWNFSLTLSFQPHYGPGVDSVSNRKEYQEYFLGVKAASVWGWQPYHLHVPTVLKSGRLILLEPSGPVQACNGIALPSLLNMPNTEHTQIYHLKINIFCVICTSRMKRSHRLPALAQVSSPNLLHVGDFRW